MAIPTLLTALGKPINHDQYFLDKGSKVMIKSPARKLIINLPLSSPISLSGQATWKEFGGGLGALGNNPLGKVGSLASGISSSLGTSLAQPSFSKKMYDKSSPISFSFEVDLVASYSAFEEVYYPAIMLLSLAYPLLYGDLAKGTKGVINLKSFIPPGPSMLYSEDSKEDGKLQGDPIHVSIGRLISLQGCYIESVGLNVDNTFDPDGYPKHIKASVKVCMVETPYATSNGFLGVNGKWGNDMTASVEAISSLLTKFTNLF